MVDLETMTVEDKQEVHAMITRHLEYTGSEPAKRILDNWEKNADLFVKVMPRDYKAVLMKMKTRKVEKAEPVAVK